MALTYGYTSVSSAQTNPDSPVDTTLMDALRTNAIHNHEMIVGNSGSYTPSTAHNHDGLNSKFVAGVSTGSITQAELKTTTGSVLLAVSSASSNSTNIALPGGEFGFERSIKITPNVDIGGEAWVATAVDFKDGALTSTGITTSYTANIYMKGSRGNESTGSLHAQRRYVTASGKEHWVFINWNKETSRIESAWEAPDHPSYGNGGDPEIMPHPFGNVTTRNEVILLDMDSIMGAKAKVTSGRGLLEVVKHDYIIDRSASIDFVPRDIDGKKTLEHQHGSYVVRGLKLKS